MRIIIVLLLSASLFSGCKDKVVTKTNPKSTNGKGQKSTTKTKSNKYAHLYLSKSQLPDGYKLVQDKSSEKVVVKEGPYIKNKGLHTGYMMWKGDAIIVNSLWVFPTKAQAKSFFIQAQKMNSGGLTADKAENKIGTDSFEYSGIIKHPDRPISLKSKLFYFQKGPYVAKIFVAWEQSGSKTDNLSKLAWSLGIKSVKNLTDTH
jgi:hypothetical protein